MITLPLRNGEEYKPNPYFMEELRENYNDVETELAKMRMWCLANPEKRKTAKGIRRFIVNWLNKGGKLKPRGMPASVMRAEAVKITPEQREQGKARLAGIKALLGR